MLHKNIVYTFGTNWENAILKYAFELKTGELIKYSSDHLSIRSHKKDKIISHYKLNKNNNENITHIKNACVNFISSFTRGTVHGYVTIWEYIMYFLKMGKNNFKVILCHNTQQGIKDIVHHFVDKNNILLLDINKQYLFDQIYFIPHKEMIFSDKFCNTYFNNFIEENIIRTISNNDLKLKPNICILKVNDKTNCTGQGVFNKKDAHVFANKNGFELYQPEKNNEINNIFQLYNCQNVVFGWGTSYYKNIRYLGNNCKKIYVIINNGYKHQYLSRKDKTDNHVYTKYKNAIVKYILCDNIKTLTFN